MKLMGCNVVEMITEWVVMNEEGLPEQKRQPYLCVSWLLAPVLSSNIALTFPTLYGFPDQLVSSEL